MDRYSEVEMSRVLSSPLHTHHRVQSLATLKTSFKISPNQFSCDQLDKKHLCVPEDGAGEGMSLSSYMPCIYGGQRSLDGFLYLSILFNFFLILHV